MTTHLVDNSRVQPEFKLVVCHAATMLKVDWTLNPQYVTCEKCREYYKANMQRYERKKQWPSWAKEKKA